MNARYSSEQSTKMLVSGQNKPPISLKEKHNYTVRSSDHLTFLCVSVKWKKLFGDAVSLSNSRNWKRGPSKQPYFAKGQGTSAVCWYQCSMPVPVQYASTSAVCRYPVCLYNQSPLWTGQIGLSALSPGSTNLNGCDNWLWPFVQAQICTIHVHSVAELEANIFPHLQHPYTVLLKGKKNLTLILFNIWSLTLPSKPTCP